MRFLRPLAAALLFASTMHAATVAVEPPNPTSAIPVVLVVTESDSCPPAPVVARDGFSISVLLGAGPCLSPPVLITYRLDVGILPPGNYDVTVTDAEDPQQATATFTVTDADESVRVIPVAGPTSGGQLVYIRANEPCPNQVICPVPLIFFGGTQLQNVTLEGTYYRAVTPPHAPGLVEVRVTNAQGSVSAPAYIYYDPAAAPIASLYEKVLIPIVYNGPGAFGSQWTTEVAIRNNNGLDVAPWRPFLTAASFPANLPVVVNSGSRPGGLLLFVPRDAAARLHYNVLIRDTTRQANDWGTEIPVVREGDLRPGPIELLNVPLDPRYRLTLRLYTLDAIPATAQVTMRRMDAADGLLHERFVTLSSPNPCQQGVPCASDAPSYAMIGDLPSDFPGVERVSIRIEGAGTARVWGFLTVTNNETQHVTVISPQ